MLDIVVTGLQWGVTGAMALAWAWCVKTNLMLSWRFLVGTPVQFRPVPMVGLITGFFALASCPALQETNRLTWVPLVIAAELWAPLGLLGVMFGRRSQAISPDTASTQSAARDATE